MNHIKVDTESFYNMYNNLCHSVYSKKELSSPFYSTVKIDTLVNAYRPESFVLSEYYFNGKIRDFENAISELKYQTMPQVKQLMTETALHNDLHKLHSASVELYVYVKQIMKDLSDNLKICLQLNLESQINLVS